MEGHWAFLDLGFTDEFAVKFFVGFVFYAVCVCLEIGECCLFCKAFADLGNWLRTSSGVSRIIH